MKFTEYRIKVTNIIYPKLIEMEEQDAVAAKIELMDSSKSELKRLLNNDQYASYLQLLYNKLMFFKSKEIISKFKELGLRNSELCWFVSLEEIEKQFLIIESKGIMVDRSLFY